MPYIIPSHCTIKSKQMNKLQAGRQQQNRGKEEMEMEFPVSAQNPNPSDTSFAMELRKEEEDDYEKELDLGFLLWRERGSIDKEADTEEEVQRRRWPRRTGGVTLEGYVEAADGDDGASDGVARTKSLTDEDLEELRGCLDLGFGFSYEEIPELCNTLPALELCYSMNQRFLDEQQQQQSPDQSSSSGESLGHCSSPASAPVANWKISSPGDDPDEVKARLRYWAQAVACTVRLCS